MSVELVVVAADRLGVACAAAVSHEGRRILFVNEDALSDEVVQGYRWAEEGPQPQ